MKFYSIGSQGPMLWNFLPLQFVNDRKKLEFLSLAGLFSLVWRLAPALPCNIRLGWKGLPGTNTGFLRTFLNKSSKPFNDIGLRIGMGF
jgi:hypothetical protein